MKTSDELCFVLTVCAGAVFGACIGGSLIFQSVPLWLVLRFCTFFEQITCIIF